MKARETTDRFGNKLAEEGCDRCWCGCKYWENDVCCDCGTTAEDLKRDPNWHEDWIYDTPIPEWVRIAAAPKAVEVTPDYATIEGLPEFPKALRTYKLHSPRNMGDPMAIACYCEQRISQVNGDAKAELETLLALIMADVNQATEDLERTRQC